jgi:hypothetical protein
MPQLDPAISNNHIIFFIILYMFMYLFLRGGLVLNISSVLKYRKKILDYFLYQKDYFFNKFVLFNLFLNIKIKAIISLYFNFILNYFSIINFIFFYLHIIFNEVFSLKKKNCFLNFFTFIYQFKYLKENVYEIH